MSIPGAETVEVPVLIVGAGPAGLAMSVALSRYGVGHLVVERHRGTAHTPRAHIINQRTVEIFRHLEISDRFHAVATPQHLMANNLWVTSCTTSRPPVPAPASRTPGSNKTASRAPRSTSSTTWASRCSRAWAVRQGPARRRTSPHARGCPSASVPSGAETA